MALQRSDTVLTLGDGSGYPHTWLLADERCAAGAGTIGRTMHGLFASMVAILTGRMGVSGIRCRVRTQLAQPLGPCAKMRLCAVQGE